MGFWFERNQYEMCVVSLLWFLLLAQEVCVIARVTAKKHVAVVGGGWGGLGAAKALVESGKYKVTVLDALPDPTGNTPFLTPTGKPFEAGFRGFWKDYPNMYDLVENELGLGLENIFTPFTNSSFYSPFGLEATAPVFSDSPFNELPSPVGQIAASLQLFENLPLSDRASMVGLLYAMLDLYREGDATLERYDRMTAHELFLRMGVSSRLVEDFIKPTLLVGLFKPPTELSAAVTMELLYYYALAHQTSFDVRWIKGRSIAETIVAPLCNSLKKRFPDDIKFLGNARVQQICMNGGGDSGGDSHGEVSLVERLTYSTGTETHQLEVDGCILALGSKGLKAVMRNSPVLASRSPELCAAASMEGIDVISVRLWLDRVVSTRTPANVLSRFDDLRGAGGTFFMLDQLQDKHMLWGLEREEEEVEEGGGGGELGSVLACDFYNAGALLPLSDDALEDVLMTRLLPEAIPAFRECTVVDRFVLRAPGAVTWFSPGSFKKRPPLEVTGVPNLKCAGDWVKMGNREHGSKGLCQERAYVAGLQAANSLIEAEADERPGVPHTVLQVRDDEPQVKLGREVNRKLQDLFFKPFGLDSFWTR